MSLFRCPVCTRRPGTKAVTIFWAWRDIEQGRHAYRQQLCADCLNAQVSAILRADVVAEELHCPRCGIVTEDTYDAVFANAFIPGYGRLDVEAPTCGPCATELRIWIRDHAVLLEDRGRADVGPSPMHSGDEILRRMGITPRV